MARVAAKLLTKLLDGDTTTLLAQLESLVAVCDASEAVRARIKAAHPGVSVVADLQEVLDNPKVDAVMVVVPSSAHFEVAERALLAGKHTYVEKPIAHGLAQAEALVALAEARDLRLMVGHLLLYHPCITWIKDAIDAGATRPASAKLKYSSTGEWRQQLWSRPQARNPARLMDPRQRGGGQQQCSACRSVATTTATQSPTRARRPCDFLQRGRLPGLCAL